MIMAKTIYMSVVATPMILGEFQRSGKQLMAQKLNKGRGVNRGLAYKRETCLSTHILKA